MIMNNKIIPDSMIRVRPPMVNAKYMYQALNPVVYLDKKHGFKMCTSSLDVIYYNVNEHQVVLKLSVEVNQKTRFISYVCDCFEDDKTFKTNFNSSDIKGRELVFLECFFIHENIMSVLDDIVTQLYYIDD